MATSFWINHKYKKHYSYFTIIFDPSRDYENESERKKSVEYFYKTQHIKQTYDFVRFITFIKTFFLKQMF
jgi:hypothetical protein